MVDFSPALQIQISLHPDTIAVLTRLAVALEAKASSPPVSAPQPIVASAPADPDPPTAAGRRSLASRGWLTPERQVRLAQLWPTRMPLDDVMAQLENSDGPPLPDKPTIHARARSLGLRRHPDLLPTYMKQRANAAGADHPIDVSAVQGGMPETARPATVPELGVVGAALAKAISEQRPRPAPRPEPAEPTGRAQQVPAPGRLETMRRVAATIAAPVPAAPIVASQEAIRAWAAQRGLSMDRFDIEVVNQKARVIGHPGFVVRPPPERHQAG